MANEELLQRTIERFWDTIPPVWGHIRSNVRANAIKNYNITLIQFHIMRHIRHGAHSVGEIAERQQISRPAISQALDLLVEKQLVTRKQDTNDRRYVHVDLTQEGNQLLDDAFMKSRLWMGEKMTSLSPDDLDILMRAMTILKTTFDSPMRQNS